jgi:hypothetical protein
MQMKKGMLVFIALIPLLSFALCAPVDRASPSGRSTPFHAISPMAKYSRCRRKP